jgi:vancomycin resistance protein YoaR
MPLKIKINLKSKLTIAVISAITFLAAGTAGFTVYEYNTIKFWSNLIYPGVSVQGVDLSGKTKDEATKILQQKYGAAILKSKININTPDRTYTLDYSKIDPKYNIDQIVNEAFTYGKDLSLFKKYKIVNGTSAKQYTLKFTYNSKPIKDLISGIQKDVDKDAVDAKLEGSGGNFSIVPDEDGQKLQVDALQKDIISDIDGANVKDTNIKAPIEIVKAKITADKLKTINGLIGSFSTDYGSISSSERANNIILATKSINGKIIMPGDTFSFNDVVGERTAQRGYQSAPVIIGNQVDSGLGGGICQVSTTLYNAILRSNIKATERVHHTLPSHYVPLGMDATVDWGNLDYKFKNTLNYPIYIEGSTSGGVVGFNVYSNRSLSDTVTEVSSQVYQTIQPSVKYVDDPTLPVGQTQEIQPPYTGYKVKVTMKSTKDGKVIRDEVIADDFYQPVDAIIKRGTKK